MAFKLQTSRDLPRQITSDLPSFDYEDVANEKPIAKKVPVLFTKPTKKIQRSLSRRLQANRQAMKVFFEGGEAHQFFETC